MSQKLHGPRTARFHGLPPLVCEFHHSEGGMQAELSTHGSSITWHMTTYAH